MRPDFGSGLLGLVFEPGGPELVATTQHLVQGALQQELGHLIAVESVEVEQDEGALDGRHRVRRAAHPGARVGLVLAEHAVRYACCDERRLRAVKEAGVLNGIEYLEVSDSEAPPRTGCASARSSSGCCSRLPASTAANVVINGGERIAEVGVEWAEPATAPPPGEDPALVAGLDDPATVLLVRTDSRGDFSRYTLRLVAGSGSDAPPAGFDPLLATVEFSFKVECPSDFDCAPVCDCPPEPADAPAIDYLAKDFDSFRSLMLDRLSLLAPEWTERTPADVGVALVELLAYVADELSYRQDAVATEAYLGTARRRASLRRHARLVDYLVHEGSNARAWVRVFVGGEGVAARRRHAAADPRRRTCPRSSSPATRTTARRSRRAPRPSRPSTTPSSTARTSASTSGRGATPAAACRAGRRRRRCVGDHPELKAGDVLVLAEVASPSTGQRRGRRPGEARTPSGSRRSSSSTDPSGGLFDDPPTNAAVDVTEIAWDEADALPFPLCISVEEQPGLVVGEAWGNIVLADHGRTIADEPLGEVPAPGARLRDPRDGCDPCEPADDEPVPVRFRPTLASAPLTHARPGADARSSPRASRARRSIARARRARRSARCSHDWLEERGFAFRAGPAVVRGGDDAWSVSDGVTVALLRLDGTARSRCSPARARRPRRSPPTRVPPGPRSRSRGRCSAQPSPGGPQPDLLGSDGDAAELRGRGRARRRRDAALRRRRPRPPARDRHRVRGRLTGSATAPPATSAPTRSPTSRRCRPTCFGVTNPLPAAGGIDPEPADAVRRDAPEAFLVQQRAVTADDYARMTRAQPPGAARRRRPSAGPARGTPSSSPPTAPAALRVDDGVRDRRPRAHLEPFRMAGYDLEVDGPRFVPLEVGLHVCVEPEYFRAHVKAAVLDVLSSRARSDGTLGFFHPDRFTLRPAGLPVGDRRGGRGGRGRRVGDRAHASSASATTPRARSTPACCRWAGSRSRGSTTTRASPSAACSPRPMGGGK